VLPELVYLNHLMRLLRQRIAEVRHDERGMTTETVIITAVLAALALAVGAIIVAKVTSKANSIPTQ
jgi:hypothetical protein